MHFNVINYSKPTTTYAFINIWLQGSDRIEAHQVPQHTSCAPQCHIVFQGRYFLDAKNILPILTKLGHYINLIKRLNVLISVEGIAILKQRI